MSYAVFPRFIGQGWDVKKSPRWKTLIAPTSSGKEVRLALYSNPLWDFELTFDYFLANQQYLESGQVPQSSALLTTGSPPTLVANDMFAIAGFYNSQQGQYGAWLFDDPTDDSIINSTIGTATASLNTQFQASRQLGAATEIIQNLNYTVQPTSISNWAASTAYSSASAYVLPTLQGMRLQEGMSNLFWQTPGWPCVYQPTGTGTSGANEPYWRAAPYVGSTLTDGSVTWTNAGVPLLVYTGANSVSLSLAAPSSYTVTATGLITFNSAVTTGNIVVITTGFYFLCRFAEDSIEFSEFLSRFWSVKSLKFTSIKL